MPREIYIMFFVIAIAVLYLGVPKFLRDFSSSILGKFVMLAFVLYMSLHHGKNAGLVSALSVVFLLSHSREGMEPHPEKKDEKNDEKKDDESDDESDDDKEEDKVVKCDNKDLSDKEKKQCETCVRQGNKDKKDYKGYQIKSGNVSCITQAQLHDLDREMKKGKKDSEEGKVAPVSGSLEDDNSNNAASVKKDDSKTEGFATYY